MNARKLYTLVLSVVLMIVMSACNIVVVRGNNGCANSACTTAPTQTTILVNP